MSMLDQLMEMGFSRNEGEEALRATNESGIEEAMNHILDHRQPRPDDMVDQPVEESEVPPKGGHLEHLDNQQSTSIVQLVEEEEDAAAVSANKLQSYKCLDCDKQLRNSEEMTMHASHTKHANYTQSFEEFKPMTEAQKQEKLAQAQAKLVETRTRKDEQAKKDAIEKELKRRQDGQSIAEIEEQRKQKEMKEWIALKKREKIEDQQARNRVLEQIKMDREARKNADHPESPAPEKPPPHAVAVTHQSTPCTETRLQIRLPDGAVIRETFKATETLGAVRAWAHMQCMEKGLLTGNIELISPFPRRVFTESDYETPLSALGLTPSASLVVQALPSPRTE